MVKLVESYCQDVAGMDVEEWLVTRGWDIREETAWTAATKERPHGGLWYWVRWISISLALSDLTALKLARGDFFFPNKRGVCSFVPLKETVQPQRLITPLVRVRPWSDGDDCLYFICFFDETPWWPNQLSHMVCHPGHLSIGLFGLISLLPK